MSQEDKPDPTAVTPAVAPPVAPPVDRAAVAIAAIAKDAKTQPEEYLKATIVPGGGE
ncbi:MAG: hypothetical protein FD180_3756 [Planctomycetota bacterium]|nr:MAG: hypothetical protein FD180_3756 [Planctomycetota bacterium]